MTGRRRIVVFSLAMAALAGVARPQTAAARKWERQQTVFDRQMSLGRTRPALATARAMCVAHPRWPLPYAYRAIAEAKLDRWTAARRDIARAHARGLRPQYRWMWAVALVHSPRRADRAAAVSDARVALHHGLATWPALTAEYVLASQLDPAAFLAKLQAAPALPAPVRWQAVATYAAKDVRSYWAAYTMRYYWGPSSRRPRVVRRPAAAHLTPWFRLAARAFGDSGQLEADRVMWLLHRGLLTAAARRLQRARKRFPRTASLAAVAEALRLAEAQRAMELGYPRRVLGLFPAPEAAGVIGMIWRARAMARLGELPAAQALLTRAVLLQGIASPSALGPHAAQANLFAMAMAYAQFRADGPLSGDALYWQGRIAFAAHDFATAAAAFQASPGLKAGIHPRGIALLAISLQRAGDARQAGQQWGRLQKETGQGLSTIFLSLRSQRRIAKTVSVQGRLAAVLCHHGAPWGVDVRDGLLNYPLRMPRAVAGVPHSCGPTAHQEWGIARANPDGALLPRYIGVLRQWRPEPGF